MHKEWKKWIARGMMVCLLMTDGSAALAQSVAEEYAGTAGLGVSVKNYEQFENDDINERICQVQSVSSGDVYLSEDVSAGDLGANEAGKKSQPTGMEIHNENGMKTFYSGFYNVGYSGSDWYITLKFADGSEKAFKKWDSEWNEYGLQETIVGEDGQEYQGQYIPGRYAWRYTMKDSELQVENPFIVASLDEIEKELKDGDVDTIRDDTYFKLKVDAGRILCS